jgi:DNA-binding transcriptional LysR family regulator
MTQLPIIKGLSLERLRTLTAIAEAGSMAVAAKGDPTRESQFSRQMKELEQAIGVDVFRKAGKTLHLTDPGRRLASTTEAFFRSLNKIVSSSLGKPQIIRIGSTETVFRWLLLPQAAEIMPEADQTALEFWILDAGDSLRRVLDGTIEIAVVEEDPVVKRVVTLPAGAMEYCFVVAKRLLRGKSAARLQALQTIPFAVLSGEGPLSRRLEQFAREAGWKMDVRVRAQSSTLLLEALRHMELAALLPTAAAEQLSKQRHAIIAPPQGPVFKRRLSVVYAPEAAGPLRLVEGLAQRLARLLLHKTTRVWRNESTLRVQPPSRPLPSVGLAPLRSD